jgi:uncharacterized delta-60 repeat protein
VRARVGVLALLLASLAASSSVSGAASSSTVVSATVPLITSISTTGCPAGTTGTTQFGNLLPGSSSVLGGDCSVSWSSNGPGAALRMYQADGAGPAMYTHTSGSLDAAVDGEPGMPTAYPGNGIVTTSESAGSDLAFGGTVQPDGRLLVTGTVPNGGTTGSDVFVNRYDADGALDASFDGDPTMPGYPGNGKVTVSHFAAGSNEAGYRSVVLSDGRILTQSTNTSPSRVCVSSMLADGTLDTSFDGEPSMAGYPGDGRFCYAPVGSSYNQGFGGMVVQRDGRIVIVGQAQFAGDGDWMIYRINSDGSLDSSFDGDTTMPGYPGNGIVRTGWSTIDDYAYDVALLADGDLVVVGRTLAGGTNFAIARYNADGTLDTSFDGDAAMPGYPGNGKVTTQVTAANDTATNVEVDLQGRIVVTGEYHNGTNWDFVAARYAADGSLDPGFDGDSTMPSYPGNGVVRIPVGASNDRQFGGLVLDEDRIVLAGNVSVGGSEDIGVVRLTDGGAFDVSLDGDGKLVLPVGPGLDNADDLTLLGDGRIAITGFTNDGSNWNAAIVTLDADAMSDFDASGPNWTADASSAFGVCLRTIGGAGVVSSWTADPDADCADANLDPWQGVPVSATTAGSTVASAPGVAVSGAVATFRFGLRVGPTQAAGSYRAPIAFEVLAP